MVAAALVAVLAVGITVFTGDPRGNRTEPAAPSMEEYAPLGEYAVSPQGVPSAQTFVEVPATQVRLVFSCPLVADGRATLRIQPEEKGADLAAALPAETFWEGPCSSEPTYLDLDGPGLVLPKGTTYPPDTFASVTINQLPVDGEGLEQNETKVRIQVFEKLGARDLRVAGFEIDQTFEEMDGKTYELARIVESEPGDEELEIEVPEEDAYVLAAVGYDASAEITGPGVAIETEQRIRVVVRDIVPGNPESLNLPGPGTFRVRVDDADPDGRLGFAVYRPIP